ncbi:MAG: ABC transporter ATP-binding protein [Streptococcaceae bacterium]|jgi:ABC-2 type transport system ATP-binding protein|nr:ABC transporter ATP-binding protein [Streptococcaceae bacterium]
MKITNLEMKFKDKVVLENVSFDVQKGERVAILGENGCGKTTLLNIINQALTPTSGRIDFEDFKMTNQNRCYIMQHETLPDEIKASEALNMFARDKAAKAAGQQLAEKFNLTRVLNKHFARLSGGEKQKLFLISSLQNSPEYFFLDEITTGLDYNSRDDLLTFLAEVFEKNSDTLFMVTHYIEEAVRLCNRFIVIKNGNITADLTKEQLVERDYSLVKFDKAMTGFEAASSADFSYKIAKSELEDVWQQNFQHIVSYERDFTRNLGEIISVENKM